MAVLWPTVRDRLVTILPTLTGFSTVTVYDGPVASGDTPSAYVTVGWQPSTAEVTAGTFSQGEGPDGFVATEEGSVLCEFASVTGDSDVPSVFGLFEAFAAYLQANPLLGVLTVGSQTSTECQVVQEQDPEGAAQRLLVSVNYQADAT